VNQDAERASFSSINGNGSATCRQSNLRLRTWYLVHRSGVDGMTLANNEKPKAKNLVFNRTFSSPAPVDKPLTTVLVSNGADTVERFPVDEDTYLTVIRPRLNSARQGEEKHGTSATRRLGH
jgi:hypothetical protein